MAEEIMKDELAVEEAPAKKTRKTTAKKAEGEKAPAKKATTKKIAAEAGVNEITIFRKFQNKKNLIETVKEHHMQIFLDKIEK